MTDIGNASLVAAFVLALYSAAAASGGKWLDYRQLVDSARMGMLATAGLLSIAAAALVYAFVTRDFGVRYVYQYSSSDMSLPYTVAAWWAGQAGSLLLWAWTLAVMGVAVVWQNRRQNLTLLPVILTVIAAVDVFFVGLAVIVSNISARPEGVVHFYNGRGTAEQWIKEGKYALNWTRLSCHRFVANQVRLALFVLAYNLGNLLRRLGLPKAIKDWSLRSLQVRLIKMGGRLVRHARRLVFQLAEMAVPRAVFQGVLERIGRLSPATG